MEIGGLTKRRFAALLLAMTVASCGTAGGADGSGQDASDEPRPVTLEGEKVPIRVAGIEVRVEIADDEAERSKGLMFRQSLPEDEGMLFVYESPRPLGFWMRNTLIPLDIAYIDAQGRIVDIQQMEPRDDTTHWSASDAQYALEMNAGWFEAHGVEIGALVEF